MPGSLSFNDVWSISEDQSGRLWIGTQGGGLNRSDRNGEPFAHYLHDAAQAESLSSDMIMTILPDRGGDLWIGTVRDGLNRFNPETRTSIQYRHNPADSRSLNDNTVNSLYEDRSGIFWIGTWNGGLDRFERETQTFNHYQHNPADPNSLSSNTVISIDEDRAGLLWVGTMDGGLNRFDKETETFKRYQHNPDDPASLSNNTVFFTYEDRAGRFWVGTGGGGINKFDRESERFIHFTTKDGLPGDTVYGMLEDSQGNLWVSTSYGLSKFNPNTETFKNYDITDGIQGNEFNMNAYFKSSGGEMFFGGPNGFTAFRPEQIRDNLHLPSVVITNFLLANKPVPIGGESVLQKSILETDHITLSYLDRVFSFEFAALNYRSPEKSLYKYKLEGFEDDWNEVDSTRRFATYTNLDPGEYVFRVVGSNNDGVWNPEGAAVKITITPPWWETLWFRGAVMVSLIGLVSGGFFWQRRSAKMREYQLEMQVNERTEELKIAKEEAEAANRAKSAFLTNMSHELRTPLNGILGYTQFLQNYTSLDQAQQKYVKIVERSGQHLLELIEDVLDIARVEAGKISIRPTDFYLTPFLTSIDSIIRLRAEQKGIEFVTEFSSNLPANIRADEKRLQQILINLLTNAVKFTTEGRVTFKVEVVEGRPDAVETKETERTALLRFTIEDTGPGIPLEELKLIFRVFHQAGDLRHRLEGVGLGLAISQQLAGLMGTVIQVKSAPGQGSTFWFEIRTPVNAALSKPAEKSEKVIVNYQGEAQTILVVDDVAINRAVLRDILVSSGFRVIEAEDGLAGLELAEQVQANLILTDIRMPRLDGYELIRRLRQSERLKATPVIGISASVFEEDRQRCLEAGADAFLTKPVQPESLFEQLQRHLKLVWIYKDDPQAEEVADLSMVFPAPEEVAALYELSLRGDVNTLSDRVTDLARSGAPQLKPFVTKMERLLEAYRLKEISQWLKPHSTNQK